MKKSYSYHPRAGDRAPVPREYYYAALALVALLIISLLFPPVMSALRVILGLSFVLFLPGYVATRAFFRSGEIDSLERFALSVGLSISLVVLAVMFSNLWLGIPINRISLLAQITSICFVFIGIIRLQKNPRFMSAWDTFIGKVTFRHRPERRPLLVLGTLIAFLVAIQYVDFFVSQSVPETSSTVAIPTIAICNDSVLYPSTIDTLYFDRSTGLVENRSGVSITVPLTDSFSDKIALLGYDMDTMRVSPGSSYGMTYHWKALDTMRANYTVFVHVTDLNSTIVFQQDHDLPVATTRMSPGMVISEHYSIAVPSNIPEGYYLIKIGLYDRKTGTRLPFSCGRFIDTSNSALIATLNVRKNTFDDYYDNTSRALYIDTRTNTTEYIGMPNITNPSLIDYGPLAVLGYDLPEFQSGKASDVTYYIRIKENKGNYLLHTLLTDTGGPGIVTVDTPLNLSVNATMLVVRVPVDLPQKYGSGESVFTFTLKNPYSGIYYLGSDTAVVRVPVL